MTRVVAVGNGFTIRASSEGDFHADEVTTIRDDIKGRVKAWLKPQLDLGAVAVGIRAPHGTSLIWSDPLQLKLGLTGHQQLE